MQQAKSQNERERLTHEAEERRKQEEHWKEQCAVLEQEAKRLTSELEKAELAYKQAKNKSNTTSSVKVRKDFEIDDSYRQDI